MYKLKVLIAGSTGYIGIQLIKLLTKHKKITIKYLCGNSSVGKKVSYFDQSLKLKKLPNIVKFNKSFLKNVDLIFTALPNGEAQDISKHLLKNNVLIDLAADFRLQKAKSYLKWYKQKHRAKSKIKDSGKITYWNNFEEEKNEHSFDNISFTQISLNSEENSYTELSTYYMPKVQF